LLKTGKILRNSPAAKDYYLNQIGVSLTMPQEWTLDRVAAVSG